MPLSPTAQPFSAESAITAFLHGIERRAFVFARAQCGDEALAGRAVTAAVAEFRQSRADKPLSQWPRDFWTVLLTQPALLQGQSQLLPELSVGPRAALLLRLVAGLDLVHAAQVLGVSETAYRTALTHALQQLQAAGNDLENLVALRERLQLEIKLPPRPVAVTEQSASPGEGEALPEAPAFLRAAVEADAETQVGANVQTELADRAPIPWRLAMSVALGLLLVALIVSFFWTPWRANAPGNSAQTAGNANLALLPAEASALVTHPDFLLLAAPADEAVTRDMAFYSWLAAGGQANEAPASSQSISTATTPPAAPSTTAPAAPATSAPATTGTIRR